MSVFFRDSINNIIVRQPYEKRLNNERKYTNSVRKFPERLVPDKREGCTFVEPQVFY